MSFLRRLFHRDPTPSESNERVGEVEPSTVATNTEWIRVPGIQLVASKSSVLSKLGGLPRVPTGFEWPLYMGRPLAFLAQIDCAEASGLDGGARLPKSGRLLFFYDQTQSTWGFDPKDRGSWRVILADGDESSFGPALRPYGLELVYPEMTVQLEALLSLAPLPLHQIWEMTDEDYEGYREARDAAYSGGPTHQLFGSAVALRDDDMEIVCQLASNGVFYGYGCPPNSELLERVSEWKLLLQTDSDIDVEFMWGDVGRLYFWIRESDLANKNFDDVWMVLQCA